jgi:hypothetical protein
VLVELTTRGGLGASTSDLMDLSPQSTESAFMGVGQNLVDADAATAEIAG